MNFNISFLNDKKERDIFRILFIHHSTGRRLINQGRIRNLLETYNKKNGKNIEFWDHDYNRIGLVNNHGVRVGYSFEIPSDNTDPDGLEILFTQQVASNPPTTPLSKVLLFDAIVFKSCFPVSAIQSEEQLEKYKQHYQNIRSALITFPTKLFVCMTPPPLVPLKIPVFVPAWTNTIDAKRARKFANWMKSEDFLQDSTNIVTYDFFDALASKENSIRSPNTLLPEYRGFLGLDSHPNIKANRTIGPLFLNFVLEKIKSFRSSE